MEKYNLAIAICLIQFISGCGSNTPTSTTSATPATVASLQGSWSHSGSTCLSLSGDPDIVAYKSPVQTFSGNVYTSIQVFYMDASCTVVALTDTATYALNIGSTGPNGVGNQVDFTPSARTYTLSNSTIAGHWNARGTPTCGITTWAANTSQSIIGKPCSIRATDTPFTPTLAVVYNLVNVDTTSSPNVLIFGDSSGANDGSTTAKRPTSYLTSYTYPKQ